MGILIVLSLYIILAFILGILAFVLKKKHSQFPDFRVGYHNQKIMKSKERWECANNMAGNLCALFAVISIVISLLLYFIKANVGTMIISFLIYSIIAILAILIVPVKFSEK